MTYLQIARDATVNPAPDFSGGFPVSANMSAEDFNAAMRIWDEGRAEFDLRQALGTSAPFVYIPSGGFTFNRFEHSSVAGNVLVVARSATKEVYSEFSIPLQTLTSIYADYSYPLGLNETLIHPLASTTGTWKGNTIAVPTRTADNAGSGYWGSGTMGQVLAKCVKTSDGFYFWRITTNPSGIPFATWYSTGTTPDFSAAASCEGNPETIFGSYLTYENRVRKSCEVPGFGGYSVHPEGMNSSRVTAISQGKCVSHLRKIPQGQASVYGPYACVGDKYFFVSASNSGLMVAGHPSGHGAREVSWYFPLLLQIWPSGIPILSTWVYTSNDILVIRVEITGSARTIISLNGDEPFCVLPAGPVASYNMILPGKCLVTSNDGGSYRISRPLTGKL